MSEEQWARAWRWVTVGAVVLVALLLLYEAVRAEAVVTDLRATAAPGLWDVLILGGLVGLGLLARHELRKR